MRYRALSLIVLLLAAMPGFALAQATGDSCRTKVNYELAREQRLYRAMLFGKPKAVHAKINEVRYDNDGMAWIKVDKSGTPWKNLDPNQSGLSWSNSTMDSNDEHKDFMPIYGVFETKRTTTSELIPYALQTIRALDCRLDVLCERAAQSLAKEGENPVDVNDIEIPGCIKFSTLKSFKECHVERAIDVGDVVTYCGDIARQLKEREIALLKLTTEYRAGYENLLQFAGNFDLFLREMRWPLAGTVRQAAALIGNLGRIPCFLSSCDIAPGTK